MITLGYPTDPIVYDIKTRGKLVFHLTNGKYITFEPDEIPSTSFTFQPNTNWPSGTIDVEPYRSRVYENCGSYSRSSIVKIIDRTGKINKIADSGLGRSQALEYVYIPTLTNVGIWGIGYCNKLKYVYSESLTGFGPLAFQDSKIENFDCPQMTSIGYAYNAFSDCSQLKSLWFPNVTRFRPANTGNFISNTPLLKELYFPKLERIDVYSGSRQYFSFGSPALERMIFPHLSQINMNELNKAFSTETGCKYAEFGRMTVEFIKSNASFGLPIGCTIKGSNGSYIID